MSFIKNIFLNSFIVGSLFFTLHTADAEVNKNINVTISNGPIKGFSIDGVNKFLGIPYAEPPTGKLRWMPPVAKKNWTKKLDANHFGQQCAQVNTLATFGGPPNNNENCLNLNVFAPSDFLIKSKPLPVLVWLHGGGNFMGAADPYDPSALVKRGLVVVTINYRLGLLGWLAHPALDGEGHDFANYGLMDQQLALKWIAKNISTFGGNSTNVTLAGESAGSLDTQAHMASPKSINLFHRAIWQSGISDSVTVEDAQTAGKAFAIASKCEKDNWKETTKCLRALSAEKIMKLQGPENNFFLKEGLISDGNIIPKIGLNESYERGEFSKLPVLSSSTLNEYNFILGVQHFYGGQNAKALDKNDYNNFIKTLSSGDQTIENQIRLAYPLDSFKSAQEAISTIGTHSDSRFECSMQRRLKSVSNKSAVYFYIFEDTSAPSVLPKMEGFQPMADHTSDIQYLFVGFHGGPDGLKTNLNKEQSKLSEQLITAWSNFTLFGNPNSKDSDFWPVYQANMPIQNIVSFKLSKLDKMTDADLTKKFKCEEWKRWQKKL